MKKYTKATSADFARNGVREPKEGEHYRVLADTSSWFDKLVGIRRFDWVLPEQVR